MRSKSIIFKCARLLSRFVHEMSNDTILRRTLIFSVLGVILCYFCGLVIALFGTFAVYVATGGWQFTWVVLNTVKRDLRGLSYLVRTRYYAHKYVNQRMTIPKLFQQTADKYPHKLAFRTEEKDWTYSEVVQYTDNVAIFFSESGLQAGDIVAIFMENRPEVVFLWLGLAKIGVISALINYNLRSESLAHCVNISEAKALIFTSEMTQAMHEIYNQLSSSLHLYTLGPVSFTGVPAVDISPYMEKGYSYRPPEIQGDFKGKLIYIYTSGTTGRPKAAVISHSRYFYMAYALQLALKIKPSDIIYNTLPMYHTAGGVLGVGQMILTGSTIVVRKKFSASKFWDDCVAFNCTIAQYIGEICRYLLAQPNRPNENLHKVRLMFGNGLRPQIWEEFQKRFGVKQMGEFYGATEGNCSVINDSNRIGCVGFTTRILPILYPITLIRVDEETGEPLRDRYGMCVHAKPGEPGEMVGKISRGDPLREFDGYVNKHATSKKIARDVFRKGDIGFLTGDVLVMDDFGYMYFRDRTGDTFRWKGENVSTSEVEAVVSNVVKLRDCVVYGVEIPGTEGRAGMATITDEHDSVDLVTLNKDIQKALPTYARPVFIRLTKASDTTGTFKLKKINLKQDGFNPHKVTSEDRLYFMDPQTRAYQPITPRVYEDICSGLVKL